MMMAASGAAEVVFVERDPALATLCRRNIALNGLTGLARVVEADILHMPDGRCPDPPIAADIVVTNPPFLEPSRSRASPDPARAAAHQLSDEALGRWIEVGAGFLRAKGRLALIHRADRLADCLKHLERAFGCIVVKAVHPRAGEAAIRIVLSAVKGSRAPLRVAPPLVLHGPDGRFLPDIDAIHRGEASLPM